MFMHTFCLYMGGMERVNLQDFLFISLFCIYKHMVQVHVFYIRNTAWYVVFVDC